MKKIDELDDVISLIIDRCINIDIGFHVSLTIFVYIRKIITTLACIAGGFTFAYFMVYVKTLDYTLACIAVCIITLISISYSNYKIKIFLCDHFANMKMSVIFENFKLWARYDTLDEWERETIIRKDIAPLVGIDITFNKERNNS